MLQERELNQIYSKCKETKDAWNSYYWLVFSYTQPERNIIWRFHDGFPANLRQIPLYTQAGKNGANVFVARIQNQLTPTNKDYFNFDFKESATPDEEIRDIVELMTQRVNELKRELKLDEIFNQSYFDLVAGTACIMREDTIHGIRFKCLPITDYCLDTCERQSVSRDYKLPLWKVGVLYPELRGRAIQGKDPYDPQQKDEIISLSDVLYYNEQTRMYEYYVRSESKVILTRQYKSSPYHLFHWNRASDMPFGAGVGMQALPAMKRLNNYVKIKLQILPFKIPMFIAKAGTIMDNNISFEPGKVLVVNDTSSVQPLPLSNADTNFDLDMQHEELEIKQTFLDYTLPADPRQMTAAEVYARSNPQDEMINLNISRLTRVVEDIGWDIFDYVFNTEVGRQSGLSLEQLHEVLDCKINNEATLDTNTIQKIQGYIATVGQIDPAAIWQSLNRTKTLEVLMKSFNLPAEMRNSGEEIDNAVEQQQEAIMNEQNAQLQAQMAIDANKENAVAGRELAVAQQKAEMGV